MQKDDFPNISLPRWKAMKVNRVARGDAATSAFIRSVNSQDSYEAHVPAFVIDFTACRHILPIAKKNDPVETKRF